MDAHVMERYCCLSSLYIRTVEFIQKTGGCKIEFDTLPDGRRIIKNVEEFPHVDRLFKIAAALQRIEDSFGMNPSARARIVLPSQEAGERDPEREKANARYFGARH
jgi:P27 family predicted phage terminase small subunit